MEQVVSTIYFDGQFWVCLVERHEAGKLYLASYTFGSEPTNPRIRNFMLNDFGFLTYEEAGETTLRPQKRVSFKKNLHKSVRELERCPRLKKSFVAMKRQPEHGPCGNEPA